jgi:hypothetical protein
VPNVQGRPRTIMIFQSIIGEIEREALKDVGKGSISGRGIGDVQTSVVFTTEVFLYISC